MFGGHTLLETLFTADAQPFNSYRDKNVVKLINYRKGGEGKSNDGKERRRGDLMIKERKITCY
jgi:hypothetical protein